MKKVKIWLGVFLMLMTLTSLSAQVKLEAGTIFAGSGHEGIIPLHWTEPAIGGIDEFKLYRKEIGSDFVEIETLSSNRGNTIDDNVEPNVEYTYKMTALVGTTEYDFDNEVTATATTAGFCLTIPGYNTTIPTIDGSIDFENEWNDAVFVDITNYSNVWTAPLDKSVYAALKVADGKLFVAYVDSNNVTMDHNEQTIIRFDFNNDNSWTQAEHDGTISALWSDLNPNMEGVLFEMFSEITGIYPNTGTGSSAMDLGYMEAAMSDVNGYLHTEISLDLSNFYSDLSGDFGIMLQTFNYDSEGNYDVTGMYPLGTIWNAPSTFLNCRVSYDEDNDAPQIVSLEGTEAIFDAEMNLELTVSDISEISLMEGEYTINGETLPLEFTSSKNLNKMGEKETDRHNYYYTAVIPAQSSYTVGTVNFTIADEHGNTNNTEDYEIIWGSDESGPTIDFITAPTQAQLNTVAYVSASIDDPSEVNSAEILFYIEGNEAVVIPMELDGDKYIANLPAQAEETNASYQIKAIDNSSNSNETISELVEIRWHAYELDWYGNFDGVKTGGLGLNNAMPWGAGVVLDLGDATGFFTKISYMCNNGTIAPLNWKVYKMNSFEQWGQEVLYDGGLLTNDLVINSDEWTDVDVSSNQEFSGIIGLFIDLPNGGYIARDGNSTHGISWFWDEGQGTWEKLGEDLPDYPGDWMIKCQLQTSLGVDEVELIAGETQLYANYPNPFNPETSIGFKTNMSGKVNLSVFNLKGELVKEIVNADLKAGNYKYNFNGANLNSGVYFYKLETPMKSITRKMMMVK